MMTQQLKRCVKRRRKKIILTLISFFSFQRKTQLTTKNKTNKEIVGIPFLGVKVALLAGAGFFLGSSSEFSFFAAAALPAKKRRTKERDYSLMMMMLLLQQTPKRPNGQNEMEAQVHTSWFGRSLGLGGRFFFICWFFSCGSLALLWLLQRDQREQRAHQKTEILEKGDKIGLQILSLCFWQGYFSSFWF